MTEEGREVEGVYVHYRPKQVLHMNSPLVDSLSSSTLIDHDRRMRNNHYSTAISNSTQKHVSPVEETSPASPWSTVTVMNAFASSYVLSKLSANTEYEVFLEPFSDTETGQPTALLNNVTFEAGNNIK